MSIHLDLVMAGLLLLFGAGVGFLAGVLFEYGRRGGTSDLEDRIRTITRLRPIVERGDGLGRGVSR